MANKYDIAYPDYNNCIVNVVSTIMEYFKIEHRHSINTTLFDKLKNGKYKKVVLIVLDGMGSHNIADNLPEDSFLSRHKIMDITSVFPSTTVTALQSIATESTPNEHCWLGWERYFPNQNKVEAGFANRMSNYEYPLDFVAKKFKAKKVPACKISPFSDIFHKANSLKSVFHKIEYYTKYSSNKFIESYFYEPDATMHYYGTTDIKTQHLFQEIDIGLANLQTKLSKSTAVIVMSDHGQIDGETYDILTKYKDFMDCLKAPISCEPTAISFRVKANKIDEFKSLFPKYLPNYMLLTAKEAMDKQIFGITENNPKLAQAIGDYFAIATGTHVAYNKDCSDFLGIHAGIHAGEMTVPLIFFDGKE